VPGLQWRADLHRDDLTDTDDLDPADRAWAQELVRTILECAGPREEPQPVCERDAFCGAPDGHAQDCDSPFPVEPKPVTGWRRFLDAK
jgi:hypothetical protein